MPGLARRRPGFVWLLAAVLVPVLLTAVVIGIKAGPTEDDLQQRSLAALDADGALGLVPQPRATASAMAVAERRKGTLSAMGS